MDDFVQEYELCPVKNRRILCYKYLEKFALNYMDKKKIKFIKFKL
jgi:hypothetical protein